MRIVLISGIVFVHIPFDTDSSPFHGAYGLFDWLRVFLRDSLFRVGVPCLSAISGYLLFRHGSASLDYGKTVRRKAKTVLLPFLLWNSVFFLFVLILQNRGIGDGYIPDLTSASPRMLATLLFAVEGTPIDLPLYFLRDLFVCILLLAAAGDADPPLSAADAGMSVTACSTAGVTWHRAQKLHPLQLQLRDLSQPSSYRPDYHRPIRSSRQPQPFSYSRCFWRPHAILTGPELPAWLEFSRDLMVLAGIPGFWALSAILIKSRLARRLAGTGSLSFWIFCAHYPLLFCLFVLWNRSGEDLYPVFYLLAAAITLTVLPLTNGLARSALPSFCNLLTGSRMRPSADVLTANGRQTTSE